MTKTITIHCLNNNSTREFERGSSLLEIMDQLDLKSKHPIINSRVNNKVEPLTFRVYENKTIEFIDASHPSAARTYMRSLSFILVKAMEELFPKITIRIEHSISKGYYCRILGETKINEKQVLDIKAKMEEYVKADFSFEEVEDETKTIVDLFRKKGYEDKARLLETTGSLYSKYYKLGDSIDYYYGCLVPSTGYVTTFGLEVYHEGLLLRVPKASNLKELEPVLKQNKLFGAFQEHVKLLDILELGTVGDLNKAIQEGKISDIIKISEALQERTIAKIAEDIAQKAKKDGLKIVLIAGPSSSGKTTFRMRLEVQLRTQLLKPVGMSLDDYFVDRDKTPRDETGDYDFESLYALDIATFNKHLEALMKGDKVELPSYNFKTGKREYNGHELQLEKDSVIIIEGIHGLNPELTPDIPRHQKYQVYISALTTISLDNHNRIPTTDNRLLRRMIRDYSYRKYSPVDTISRWASVRRGEDKWIFPFQENADAMFNSAMIYELATMRPHAERILREVPNSAPEYAEAYRLLKFVQFFNYIDDKELPPTSLLREFLGGSSFKY